MSERVRSCALRHLSAFSVTTSVSWATTSKSKSKNGVSFCGSEATPAITVRQAATSVPSYRSNERETDKKLVEQHSSISGLLRVCHGYKAATGACKSGVGVYFWLKFGVRIINFMP